MPRDCRARSKSRQVPEGLGRHTKSAISALRLITRLMCQERCSRQLAVIAKGQYEHVKIKLQPAKKVTGRDSTSYMPKTP